MNPPRQVVDVVDRRRERDWLFERNIEKLLEPEVRYLTITATLNDERSLIVACDLSAKKLEFLDVSDGLVELNLSQNVFSLRE